eukprot:CAMPEP_0170136024 /NCGR_PEP_ID=MMETSP0033_2-20121228/2921_1 /TAXON_ID=195969 /ORGANISM="Dolichomastix tenuilepis, Strain CCMP3274" /LENGTH=244 /DNA_ID=CAMNT_0010371673 /DNA_START=44 /DNA_END=778 /DNA_ORIENTATION=-
MEAPRSVDEVFDDFYARREGLLRALTTEVDAFYAQCDPSKENLCLYGNPDTTWEVQLPAPEVPPELPEPALGINFARDGMQKKDWLALVAVHSDAWLMAVAYYYGAKFDRGEREKLFKLINQLPTVYETLCGKTANGAKKGAGKKADANKRGREEMEAAAAPVAPATGKSKPSAGRVLLPEDGFGQLQGAKVELFWPDDGMWYGAEIVSVNNRNRTAKVLYATGDVETMSLDEIAQDGHLNILS